MSSVADRATAQYTLTNLHTVGVLWLPALLHNIFNVKGLFHIVLQPLSTGGVDTILVFSFFDACQNMKLVNYLSSFSKYKSIFLTQCCIPAKR